MESNSKAVAILWFDRDWRLSDQPALHHALQLKRSGQISAVRAVLFVPEAPHPARRDFLEESAGAFELGLQSLGIPTERTSEGLGDFARKLSSPHFLPHVLFFGTLGFSTPDRTACAEVCRNYPGSVFFESATLLRASELPWSVDETPETFTDFRKRIEPVLGRTHRGGPETLSFERKLTPLSAPDTIQPLPLADGPPLTWWDEVKKRGTRFRGGYLYAQKHLHHYLFETRAVSHYKTTRNGLLLPTDSSKLSAWLAWGCLSPREVYQAVQDFEKAHGSSEETYWLVFELLWRDYFKWIALKKLGNVISGARAPLHGSQQDLFDTWKAGLGDSEFVNAGCRELSETGFVSNRLRQNMASYLVKTLGVPWQAGEHYFSQVLVDYDRESNLGNWLYLAGQGQDPRDRTFNPDLQASKYDPNRIYQKLWGRV